MCRKETKNHWNLKWILLATLVAVLALVTACSTLKPNVPVVPGI